MGQASFEYQNSHLTPKLSGIETKEMDTFSLNLIAYLLMNLGGKYEL